MVDIDANDSEMNNLKSENNRLKKELHRVDKMLSRLHCVLFKFMKRSDGQFVYTYTSGIPTKPQNAIGTNLVGFTLDEMFYPPTASYLKDHYEQAYRGHMVTYEIFIHERYYITVLSPIQENGKTIEVVGTSIDITDKKELEGELNNQSSVFSAIFNEALDAIILFDDSLLPIDANPAASQLFGFTKEELKSGEHLPLLDDLIKSQIPDLFDRLKQNGILKGEAILKRKDGRPCFIEHVTRANILPNAHLTILRDITERKELEKSLRKSETLQVVGELAAGIGHEIRNPMTAVKGFIQLLKEDPTNFEYFNVILNEFDRIETIISEFMVLSKPQAHHFDKEDVSLIMKNTITLMEPQANLMNVQIELHIQDELPQISCEKNQLKQVFINMIKNGIECMDNGGKLSIEVGKDEGRLNIKIKDEGCGIPPEMIKRIGEPFYTTKMKGTGLGMMMSYRIIQNHKGTIHLESELDKGTVFTITLPIQK